MEPQWGSRAEARPSRSAGPLGPGMGVNEAPVEPQSHALPEAAGESRSFPCIERGSLALLFRFCCEQQHRFQDVQMEHYRGVGGSYLIPKPFCRGIHFVILDLPLAGMLFQY